MSPSVPALRTESCTPFARAASWVFLMMPSAFGLFGLTSTAITPALGASSVSSSTSLGISSVVMLVKPVMLPPGRARLATRPIPTGSPALMKTIGIVEVALFAASAGGVLPVVTITSTLWATRSASSRFPARRASNNAIERRYRAPVPLNPIGDNLSDVAACAKAQKGPAQRQCGSFPPALRTGGGRNEARSSRARDSERAVAAHGDGIGAKQGGILKIGNF